MKKIFLDTNFIIDLLVRDGELQVNALKVLENGAKKNLRFYVSFLTLANFAYITRKDSKERLFDNLKTCCRLFKIIANNQTQLLKAIDLNPTDFEDAIQYETAQTEKCDCIITRDPKGFEISNIPVLSPLEFLENIV